MGKIREDQENGVLAGRGVLFYINSSVKAPLRGNIWAAES